MSISIEKWSMQYGGGGGLKFSIFCRIKIFLFFKEKFLYSKFNFIKSYKINLICIYDNGFSGAVSRGKAIFRFLKKKLIILFIREMHVSIHLKHEEIKNANENTLFVQLV